MSSPLLRKPPSSTLYSIVRSRIFGYSDVVLNRTKDEIADELGVDGSDMDAVLADHFNVERCTGCGYWFDKSQCGHDDERGGFECNDCHAG